MNSEVREAGHPGPATPEHFGMVAIMGRPNVGKSTLMNHLIGQKVSITSRKRQTTRHRILGILTEGAYQAVFIDTPGLSADEKKALPRMMNRTAERAASGVELVLFVVEAGVFGEEDELVAQKLEGVRAPVAVIINKIDRFRHKEELLPFLEQLSARLPQAELVPVSALKGQNLDDLKAMVLRHLPAGPHGFADSAITDRNLRFMAAEIIREKLMRQMGDELPYSAAVEIEAFEEKGALTRIFAKILVEREGQKKMVVGEGGRRIKLIGSEARADLERLLDGKVYLELFVKVKSGWSDDERALRSLGISDTDGWN